MSLLSLSCLTDVQTCLDLEPWESLGLHGDQNQSKGNQSWISIGRTDTEAETPVLWPPDVKNLLIGKDSDAWKDWRWEEKGTTEDEMVGWHHLLDGHEFEQAPGVGDGQGSLACCSPWGCKEADTTERLNQCISLWRGRGMYKIFNTPRKKFLASSWVNSMLTGVLVDADPVSSSQVLPFC